MDDITFVRSHWWLVSEGFSLSTANPMYRNSPPLCTIVLQIPITGWWQVRSGAYAA